MATPSITHALTHFPSRLRIANGVQVLLCLLLVILVVVALTAIFGRTGERIAVQLCVNIAAVVALGVFCGNTGIVSFGHGSFMLIGAYLSGILTMPATVAAHRVASIVGASRRP